LDELQTNKINEDGKLAAGGKLRSTFPVRLSKNDARHTVFSGQCASNAGRSAGLFPIIACFTIPSRLAFHAAR